MNIRLDIGKSPKKVFVQIRTNFNQKVFIGLRDYNNNKTYYTKRYAFIDGVEKFFILMPQCPNTGELIIFNSDSMQGLDSNFKIDEIRVENYDIPPHTFSKKTSSFLRFAQEFCKQCSYLDYSKEGVKYKSKNEKFTIDLMTNVLSSSGSYLPTPARISQLNGKMEVSYMQFLEYTVPMRMAILLHEYSHFYVNKVPRSEIEADINGLGIYLKLGYPSIDIFNVFLKVFKVSPSMENKDRFQTLEKFVKENRDSYE